MAPVTPDILKNNFPYNNNSYNFINKNVIITIRKFCRKNSIKAFYAKGSIIHGCMIYGSDIDHVRIQTKEKLNLKQKRKLIKKFERKLREVGVSELKRIREDNYVRVFKNWEELENFPNANTKFWEIWPNIKIITAKNANDLFEKIMKIKKQYPRKIPPKWDAKIAERIFKMKYPISKEYINLENYSPFSHINEVSKKYQQRPFKLPFVEIDKKIIPIHPDTFSDLKIKKSQIKFSKQVWPTSSFRTVYLPEEHICIKLPILRKITRGLRNLSKKELKRSENAMKKIQKIKYKNLTFLPEIQFYSENENFNYIKRLMPNKKIVPWFYIIKSQKFNEKFMMKIIKNIIKSWIYFAKKGLYLEFHTQNILVDKEAKLYYRDLSDIRCLKDEFMTPSYAKKISESEVLSTVFDRTVCKQNLDHVFRYDTKLGEKNKLKIRKFLKNQIKKSNLEFPNYSLDFPNDKPERIPEKTELVWWRQ